MSTQLSMTMEQLQILLNKQKSEIANYMTRNLSMYSWWQNGCYPEGFSIEDIKNELRKHAEKAPYADDFQTLQKYIK